MHNNLHDKELTTLIILNGPSLKHNATLFQTEIILGKLKKHVYLSTTYLIA